ncbi:diaminopimelate epimerase [Methylomusa anaerophila]|uniref:Diaminopimelate epimerase n=2 Tax=Methylomusa anaerophila TaxID=1930071 RepID=A0A348APM0_9FIRM|nr:diaminopimelate epimerase [Methylomusa anaerophila]
MEFSKWHGLGNDFILVNGSKETISNYQQLATQLCNRHFGVGADGLVIVSPGDSADFNMRIFNSDGSEADMCGNATRCVARYVYENGMTDKTTITLSTLAGIITPELLFRDAVLETVKVDMGEPRLTRKKIPMTGNPDEQVINIPITVNNSVYNVTAVSMGNPHCIIFVDDVESINLTVIGPLLETHSFFPRKTNVEFVQVIDRNTVRMRVWERGAGITQACGTGACATLVASVLNGHTERQAVIKLDGGDLYVEWGADNHLSMSGPAVEVFRGKFLL